jgi:hypothetical protein
MSLQEIIDSESKQTTNASMEVIPEKELRHTRYHKLIRAMRLWNSDHEECKIVFKAGDEIKTVQTAVWFVSEKHVCIKAGMTILVSCILDVIV